MGYAIQENLIRVNSHTRPGKKISIKGLVIHWTANEANGADNDAHYRYFNKGTVYASAHYFVDSKGILRIIPENEMAYHVGAKSYKTSKYSSYPNGTMIGVEMCVNADGNFAETYKRAVWLCADILRRNKLSINELERHYDITGKSCPKMFTEDYYANKYMGMTAAQAHAKFRKDVAAALNPPAPKPAPKPAPTPVSATTHKVINGDTLWGISRKYGVSVADIKKINGLKSDVINPGDVLYLSKDVHVVKSGDTLWGISREHGISVSDIKKINGLKSDVINPGDVLYLSSKVHVVQSGDTLWGISRDHGISVEDLKRLNGLKSNVINPGDVLKLG